MSCTSGLLPGLCLPPMGLSHGSCQGAILDWPGPATLRQVQHLISQLYKALELHSRTPHGSHQGLTSTALMITPSTMTASDTLKKDFVSHPGLAQPSVMDASEVGVAAILLHR